MIKPEPALPAKTKASFFYGYIIVGLIFIIQLAMVGSSATSGIFFKPLINEFGWSRALISGAFSFSRIMQGLSGIIMGGLNDRLGPRFVITICGFLAGAGFMLMSRTSAVWQLYLYYVVILGVGMGGVFAPQMSTIARWFTQRRNLMTGIVFIGGSLGGLLTPPAVNWLISTAGWQNSYLILGAVALVIIVLAAQFLRGDPYRGVRVTSAKNDKPEIREAEPIIILKSFSLKEAVSTRQFWIVTMAFFSSQFCLSTLMVHIVPHATDLGISSAAAANILAVLSAGFLFGCLAVGIGADRIGVRKVYVICLIPMLAILLLLLPVSEAWLIGLLVFIVSFGNGGNAPLVSTLCAELFGMRSHGLILGLSSLIGALGGALGPFIAGYVFDTNGNYQWAFIWCGALVVAGLVMAVLLRPIKAGTRDSPSPL
jgi:MFS transporter, OFA family, oxalate/formate antiporter